LKVERAELRDAVVELEEQIENWESLEDSIDEGKTV